MDPLIAPVLAAITSYVSTQTEELLNKVGDLAFANAKAIFLKLKERWRGDELAARELETFEKEPKVYAPVVEARLDQKLHEDPELRAELKQLVNDIGPQIEVMQKMAHGQGIIGVEADHMTRGTANVRQEITEATDVVGAKFKSIG